MVGLQIQKLLNQQIIKVNAFGQPLILLFIIEVLIWKTMIVNVIMKAIVVKEDGLGVKDVVID
mgnify:CR=1 FL=1